MTYSWQQHWLLQPEARQQWKCDHGSIPKHFCPALLIIFLDLSIHSFAYWVNSAVQLLQSAFIIFFVCGLTLSIFYLFLFVCLLCKYHLMQRGPPAGVCVLDIGSPLYQKRHHPILTIGRCHLCIKMLISEF